MTEGILFICIRNPKNKIDIRNDVMKGEKNYLYKNVFNLLGPEVSNPHILLNRGG